MNLRRLRRVDEDPRLQNCPAASMYYANCAAFVVLCRQQYYSHWSSRWCCPVCTMATPRLPVYLEIARQTAVGDQCRSTTCLLCTKVRAHNAATPRPLVGCRYASELSLNSPCSPVAGDRDVSCGGHRRKKAAVLRVNVCSRNAVIASFDDW